MFRRNPAPTVTVKRVELDASTRDILRSFAEDLTALHALNSELIQVGDRLAASLNGHITDALLTENDVDVFVYDQGTTTPTGKRKQASRMSRKVARAQVCEVINESGWIEPHYHALRWALAEGRGGDEHLVEYFQRVISRECKTLLFEHKVEKAKAKHPGSYWRFYKPRGSAPIS